MMFNYFSNISLGVRTIVLEIKRSKGWWEPDYLDNQMLLNYEEELEMITFGYLVWLLYCFISVMITTYYFTDFITHFDNLYEYIISDKDNLDNLVIHYIEMYSLNEKIDIDYNWWVYCFSLSIRIGFFFVYYSVILYEMGQLNWIVDWWTYRS